MPRFLVGKTNVPASDMTIGTDYLQTNNGSGNNNNNNGGGGETNFDTNMVIILAALLCALVCALGLNTIVRCALRCGRRVAMEQQAGLQATAVVGLKKRALRKIPVEVYGPNTSVPGTECPICLGDFADGEKVRVLPKCHHGFHVRCIDTWLSEHPSCPTCRSLIIDDQATDVSKPEGGAQHPNTEAGHVTVQIADERR